MDYCSRIAVVPRFTLDYGDKFDEVLSRLAEDKTVSKAEVIRRAVATYNYLNEQIKIRGKQVKLSLSDENDRVIKDIVIP